MFLFIITLLRVDSVGSARGSNKVISNGNWVETSKLENILVGLTAVNNTTTILHAFVVTIKQIAHNLVRCRL